MTPYALPDGYQRRIPPRPWDDFAADPDVVWQPQVYPRALQIARKLGADTILDVGCGTATKLLALDFDGDRVGIDTEPTVEQLKAAHPSGLWVKQDLERGVALPHTRNAVVVCADVIEHLVTPEALIGALVRALTPAGGARAVLISTPDRERARGEGDLGPPANRAHAQEWTLLELRAWLEACGLRPTRWSHTQSKSTDPAENTCLVEIEAVR